MVQIYTRERLSPAKRQAPSSDFHLSQFFRRRPGRQAQIFMSLNIFGLFSTAHVYITCICIYVYLFLERVCIIVRRGRRTANFWRVNSYGADLHPREAFVRQAPFAKLGFASTSFFVASFLCLVRFEPGRVRLFTTS